MYNGVFVPRFDFSKVNDVPSGTAKLLYNSSNANIEINCQWAMAIEQIQGQETPAVMYDKTTDAPITFVSPVDGEIYPLPCTSSTRARFTYVKRDNNGVMYFDDRGFPIIMYMCEDNVPRVFQFQGQDQAIIGNHFTEFSTGMRNQLIQRDPQAWKQLIVREYGNIYSMVANAIDNSYGNDGFPAMRRDMWDERMQAAGNYNNRAMKGDDRFYRYGGVPGMPSDQEHQVNLQRNGGSGFKFGSDNSVTEQNNHFSNGFNIQTATPRSVSPMDINPDCIECELKAHIEKGGDPYDFVDSRGNHILISKQGQKQNQQQANNQSMHTNSTSSDFNVSSNATSNFNHGSPDIHEITRLRKEIADTQAYLDTIKDDYQKSSDFEEHIAYLNEQLTELTQSPLNTTGLVDNDFAVTDFDEEAWTSIANSHEVENIKYGYGEDPTAQVKFDTMEDYIRYLEVREPGNEEDQLTGNVDNSNQDIESSDPFYYTTPIGMADLNVTKEYTVETNYFNVCNSGVYIGSPETVLWIRINDDTVIPAWYRHEAYMRPSIHGSLEGKVSIDTDQKVILISARNNIIRDIVVDRYNLDGKGSITDPILLGLGDGFIEEITSEDLSEIKIEKGYDVLLHREKLSGSINDVTTEVLATNREACTTPLYSAEIKTRLSGNIDLEKVNEILEELDGAEDSKVQVLAYIISTLHKASDNASANRLESLVVNYMNEYALIRHGFDYSIESFILNDKDFVALKKEFYDNDGATDSEKSKFGKMMQEMGEDLFDYFTFVKKDKYLNNIPLAVKEGVDPEDLDDLLNEHGKFVVKMFEARKSCYVLDISHMESAPTYGEVLKSSQEVYTAIIKAHETLTREHKEYVNNLNIVTCKGEMLRVVFAGKGENTRLFLLSAIA